MAYDVILPSAVRTTGAAQSGNYTCPRDETIRAELQVTASSGPTTLDASVEHSSDGGNTWFTLASFTQVGAVGTAKQSILVSKPHSGLLRVNYTVAGTSYTFSVTFRREGAGA